MGNANGDMQVLILAGGRSARLRPLSVERPKTLLPVGNVAILKRLLSAISEAGLSSACLSLPYLWGPMKDEVLAMASGGFDLQIDTPKGAFKGTVQDVLRMSDARAHRVLVIYGDSFLSADLGELCRAHEVAVSKGGVATILVHRPSDIATPERDGRTHHGVISIDDSGRVTRFVEKPLVEEIKPGFDLANAAVFVCELSWLQLPAFSEVGDFSRHVFQPTVSANTAPIYAQDIGKGFRIDVGTVQRYFDTNMSLLAGRLRGHLPGHETHPGVYVAHGTNLQGVIVEPPVLFGSQVTFGCGVHIGPNAIVGNASHIGDNSRLQNTILLDHCVVSSNVDMQHVILGTGCRISDGQRLAPFTVLGSYSTSGGTDWPYWSDCEF